MKRYRIYQLPATPDNIDLAQERYQYFRATPSGLLIYTDKRKPAGAILIKRPENLHGADQGWIAGCNAMILEETSKSQPEQGEKLLEFLASLERELEKEQKALKGV